MLGPNASGLDYNDLVTDPRHRKPSTRFGTTKTMHSSFKKNMRPVWDPSYIIRTGYLRAQSASAWQTTVRIWRIF